MGVRVIVSIGMSKNALYNIPSIQSESISLNFDPDETTLRVNKLSRAVTLDMLAILHMVRPRKKIPMFPLSCSKILGSVGRKKILFF
jgi:hypothetical protein